MAQIINKALVIGSGLVLIILATGTISAEKDKGYDQYLIISLKDKNEGIRTSAAQILGERKCKQAIEPLKEMIKKDEFYAARIVAALALFEIGDESVISEIKKVALNDKNPTVRHVLAGVVYELQNKYLAKL